MMFRTQPLSYDAMTAQLESWAEAHPEFVHLESAGKSTEGRELWVLVIGREPDRLRPAAWVDGNMHACELAGSSVALAIAEDLIALLSGADAQVTSGLSAPVRRALEDTLVYVMPRMSPDGAERVLQTGQYVRSLPSVSRTQETLPRWVRKDINGDGRVLTMRKEDPNGEFVESKAHPGLMLARDVDDEGPFYALYPEGEIDGFDGFTIPAPFYLSDNDTDLNRNFPYHWAPEPQQLGAGAFPMSAPESRAVVEYTTARPHLYLWLNLHCFGGVHIRPRGDVSDSKMHKGDLAVYRLLGKWAEELTSYPMVSGFEEFTYEEGKPLHGDLIDYAYHQRGCYGWVCEIWDLFERIGQERPKRFVDRYVSLTRGHAEKLHEWDSLENEGRIFVPWEKSTHPQLGEVEIGGIDNIFGVWNPPPEELSKICEGLSLMFLKSASLTPRLELDVQVESIDVDTTRVTATLMNTGYLGTGGPGAAKDQPFNAPPRLVAETDASLMCDKRVELPHLRGWGHGLESGFGLPFEPESSGSTDRARVSWVAKGGSEVRVVAGSSRTGFVEKVVKLK